MNDKRVSFMSFGKYFSSSKIFSFIAFHTKILKIYTPLLFLVCSTLHPQRNNSSEPHIPGSFCAIWPRRGASRKRKDWGRENQGITPRLYLNSGPQQWSQLLSSFHSCSGHPLTSDHTSFCSFEAGSIFSFMLSC